MKLSQKISWTIIARYAKLKGISLAEASEIIGDIFDILFAVFKEEGYNFVVK